MNLQPLSSSICSKPFRFVFLVLFFCNCTAQKTKKNAATYPVFDSDTAIFKKDNFINRFGNYEDRKSVV